jgi:hypothetical protein
MEQNVSRLQHDPLGPFLTLFWLLLALLVKQPVVTPSISMEKSRTQMSQNSGCPSLHSSANIRSK